MKIYNGSIYSWIKTSKCSGSYNDSPYIDSRPVLTRNVLANREFKHINGYTLRGSAPFLFCFGSVEIQE